MPSLGEPRQLDPFRRPSWPLLYLDLLLGLALPVVLWWAWSLFRLGWAPRRPLTHEVGLCVSSASLPTVVLGWRLLRTPAPPAQPWLFVDPGVALAASGGLTCLLVVALLRAWRLSAIDPSVSAQPP